MPLLATRSLLFQDIEDPQKRRLKRRVACLKRMHESHTRSIGIEAVSLESACFIKADAVREMGHRVFAIGEDFDPTGITQGLS
jgi:hypothetical protein